MRLERTLESTGAGRHSEAHPPSERRDFELRRKFQPAQFVSLFAPLHDQLSARPPLATQFGERADDRDDEAEKQDLFHVRPRWRTPALAAL
jgi:hypothetical protein